MIGTVIAFAGPDSNKDSGWLACDGIEVSRTTYANLFNKIGTTWGSGDGTTTFNVPDLRGQALIGTNPATGGRTNISERVLGQNIGDEDHTLTEAEIPSHNHTFNASSSTATEGGPDPTYSLAEANAGGSSAIYSTTAPNTALVGTTVGDTGSGTAHTNMQPSAVINYYIVAEVTQADNDAERVLDLTLASSANDSDVAYIAQGNADTQMTLGTIKADRVPRSDLTDTEDLGSNPTAIDVDSRSEFKYTCTVTASHTQTFSNVSDLGGFICLITNTANAPTITFSGVTLSLIRELPIDFSFSSNALTFPNDGTGSKTYTLIATLIGGDFKFGISTL